MTALHDTGELTCPRCGEALEGDFGTVKVDTGDEQVRTDIDCPECDAPLQVVIETALPEALGVDIWIEDRRDDS